MAMLIKANNVQYAALPEAGEATGTRLTGNASSGAPDAAPHARHNVQARPTAHDATLAELNDLKEQFASLTRTCAELEHNAQTRETAAWEAGLAEGLIKGEARAQEDHGAREMALRTAMESAVGALRAKLDAVEAVSVDIALAALERILGQPDGYASLVAQTAKHHVAQLAAGSVLAIEVSRDDFPDDDRLGQFAWPGEQGGGSEVRVSARTRLRPGQCRIRLNLGALDAGLDSQLARIREALREACE
jgi:flagellar assembly protein FliH